jgi:hypothetical protein
MPNRWVSHVRNYAKQHNMSYRDALKSTACVNAYHSQNMHSRRNNPSYNDVPKVTCSMCRKRVPDIAGKTVFLPVKCKNRQTFGIDYGHRICHNCWFNRKDNFAREVDDDGKKLMHECPGCLNGVKPPTPLPKPPRPVNIIERGKILDLTEGNTSSDED